MTAAIRLQKGSQPGWGETRSGSGPRDPQRLRGDSDAADLQEVYDTERQLLYVACIRARDHLLVTGLDPVSEFLDDITKGKVFGGGE